MLDLLVKQSFKLSSLCAIISGLSSRKQTSDLLKHSLLFLGAEITVPLSSALEYNWLGGLAPNQHKGI